MGKWNAGRIKYPTLASVVAGIYAHTRPDGGCLVSTRKANVNGYACQVYQRRQWLAHRLVALYYLGPCPSGQEVRHLCGRGKQGCVTASHLRYGTPWENVQDTVRMGKNYHGGTLTAEQLAEAARLRAAGMSYRKIGQRFDRCGDVMRKALNGITYKRIRKEAPLTAEVEAVPVQEALL